LTHAQVTYKSTSFVLLSPTSPSIPSHGTVRFYEVNKASKKTPPYPLICNTFIVLSTFLNV